ncbi:NIPA-like protein 2 [Tupaia chinensis]|uniref:NIPA-like protein 2 n=1 Tax=Tupaia chinensis TaxID=246437 RepID=L9JAQ5_TUPCH|nr:NIPA-like protein 2 [Tupaia chinensis]
MPCLSFASNHKILLSLAFMSASLTVISVKAVSSMITFSMTDKMQLTYPIFYIMFTIMIASCVFQVKFLNQATKLYNTTTVVPVNHIFFTTSAIIAGKQMLDKIQPDSNNLSYGTLPDGSDSTKSQSGEKKEV